MVRKRFTAAASAAFLSFFCLTSADSAANAASPRFVVLAGDSANGRRGPGLEHRIDWIYQRSGLPLEVIGESGPWRRVRDPDGGETWMHARNLAAGRSVYVSAHNDVALRKSPHENARVLAYLAPGVTPGFTGCEGGWRRVTIGGRVGWVQAEALWGADCARL